jgi:hypothetical protein
MINEIYQAADQLEQRINNANQAIINISATFQEVIAKGETIFDVANRLTNYERK